MRDSRDETAMAALEKPQWADLRRRAQKQAAHEYRSVASLIRVALRDYLDSHEPRNDS